MLYYKLFRRKKDALSASPEELIALAAKNLKEHYGVEKTNTSLEIKDVGPFLQGTAYNHETDGEFTCIGVEFTYTYKFDIMDKPETTTGFTPVWTNAKNNYDPISFEQSYFGINNQSTKYDNGCGDHLDVDKILIPKETMQKYFKPSI